MDENEGQNGGGGAETDPNEPLERQAHDDATNTPGSEGDVNIDIQKDISGTPQDAPVAGSPGGPPSGTPADGDEQSDSDRS